MEYAIFESDITVRPDDIDMNNHVHYSKYLDYLLTARYDQMRKDYGMSMEEFIERGFSWVASKLTISYKRGILLGDKVKVKTQVASVNGAQVEVNFWILKGENEKLAAEGQAQYTMVSISNGRPVRIPQDIIDKYSK
ncbi:MAG: acyl-CoA thioesterase [Ignavibacteria bacterium]|nr:MAG: acyl-CoA thioesterase [Ignavibacteria bacterium]